MAKLPPDVVIYLGNTHPVLRRRTNPPLQGANAAQACAATRACNVRT